MSIVQESFPQAVNEALQTVNRILNVERDPRLAEKVDHKYMDKYDLADQTTNMTLIALMNVFECMGLSKKHLERIEQSPDMSKTLRFQASDSCKFLKEQTVSCTVDGSDINQTTTEETYSSASGGDNKQSNRSSLFHRTGRSTIQKVVKEIKEYHWNVEVQWELSLYSGSDFEATKQVLSSRTTSMVVVVQSDKKAPLPEYRDHPPVELPVTWFFQQVDITSSKVKFAINRTTSKTPLRNAEIHEALENMAAWKDWAFGVRSYFVVNVQRDIVEKNNPAIITADSNSMPMLSSVSASKVFVPILPLLEEKKSTATNNTGTTTSGASAAANDATKEENSDEENVERRSKFSLSRNNEDGEKNNAMTPLLSINDMHRFLNEQIRSLLEKTGALERFFPNKNHVKLHSASEATFVMLCLHIISICQRYVQSMEYMEQMLEEQLMAAIGKRVTSDDLDAFCKFHFAKLFRPRPVPFCKAIRQPGHYPVGLISIESTTSSTAAPITAARANNIPYDNNNHKHREPIETFMRKIENNKAENGDDEMMNPLKIPLNAAATAVLTGERFLHGWLNQRFESKTKSYELIARARQFSSYLLVIGTMTSSDTLKPKEAIILRNKDEVILPILLNEIPSAKEFKDAIQSLSQEQQRFSIAFRNMQLESSVFGVCVIQIKPQLETLLGLPSDALTKEMKLTEELMELFCDYQVPSDLLSYNGPDANASVEEKIGNVKEHVKAVLDVIGNAKSQQLEQAAMKADMVVETAIADDPSVLTVPVFAANSGMLSPEEKERIFLQKLERGGGSSSVAMAYKGADMITSRPHENRALMARSSPPPPLTAVAAARSVPESITTTIQATETIPITADSTIPSSGGGGGFDITQVPKVLDAAIEKHMNDSALRTTIIQSGDNWTRLRQENLLVKAKLRTLSRDTIQSERNQAFDLLDALSRSGSLPISCSELHIIVCVTHSFEKTVMNTLIQDNVNPIERLEMSALLLASTIHGQPATNLIGDDRESSRLASNFPSLLESAGNGR